MKVGVRKPNLKKSIKAKTTGKVKRTVKKTINPLYGKKGMGYVNNPKKAVYNKIYNKTTVDARPVSFKSKKTSKQSQTANTTSINTNNLNNSNVWVGLNENQLNEKIIEIKNKRKISKRNCIIMYLIFAVSLFYSFGNGSFLSWSIVVLSGLWAIISGMNISIYKKDLDLLNNRLISLKNK